MEHYFVNTWNLKAKGVEWPVDVIDVNIVVQTCNRKVPIIYTLKTSRKGRTPILSSVSPHLEVGLAKMVIHVELTDEGAPGRRQSGAIQAFPWSESNSICQVVLDMKNPSHREQLRAFPG